MSMPVLHSLSVRLDEEEPRLRAISDEKAVEARPGRTWTRKQELGHLLDSAANNRMRFVNAAISGSWTDAGYDQNAWVAMHDYNALPWPTLIDIWTAHNRLLAHVIERIPADRLDALCHIGSLPPLKLSFVIEDYILHMQHHLDQILDRKEITAYPGAKLSASPGAAR